MTTATTLAKTTEKLCVFCRNLDWDRGLIGGDYPEPAKMHCIKGYWNDGIVNNLDAFREAIVMAKDCPDYQR